VAELKEADPSAVSGETILFAENSAAGSLNFDSIDGLELALALEEQFGLEFVDDVDFSEVTTVNQVVALVEGHVPSSGVNRWHHPRSESRVLHGDG